jgi:hypothetical protein
MSRISSETLQARKDQMQSIQSTERILNLAKLGPSEIKKK